MSDMFGGEEKVDFQPTEIREDKKKLRKLRTALFRTEGGALGEELEAGEVAGRDTFFGN